jgi:SAM-dependent methyltransferase
MVPMNYEQLIETLAAVVGTTNVVADPESLDFYSSDLFDQKILAELVARPRTVDEVSACVRHCTSGGRAVIPRGGGFSQQDAACTRFADGSFDLVVSLVVHQETPIGVIRAMLKECHRLPRPGGVMIHDGSLAGELPKADPFQRFMSEWFPRNNNKPFGKGFDAERDFVAAGFSPVDIFSGKLEGDEYPRGQLSGRNYIGAAKR